MITREMVETIKRRREGGITDEQIQALLQNGGYSEEDIAAAMQASYQDTSSLPSEANPAKKKKSWWPF